MIGSNSDSKGEWRKFAVWGVLWSVNITNLFQREQTVEVETGGSSGICQRDNNYRKLYITGKKNVRQLRNANIICNVHMNIIRTIK
jgi:hypothetical protein